MSNYLRIISKDFLLDTPAVYSYDVSDLEIPKISKSGELFVLDTKHMGISDFVSMTITAHKKDCMFTAKELDRLPHELVKCLFSTNLEIPLGRIKIQGNDSDTYTPDIVNHITMTVAEISTSIFNSSHARKQKLADRGKDYTYACSSRGLSLGFISVSLNELTTDFSFDTQTSLASDIITAYNIGRAIQRDAEKFGYKRNTNDENSDIFSILNDQFEESSIILDRLPKTIAHIESEDWNRWSKHSKFDASIYETGIMESRKNINKLSNGLSTEKITRESFDNYLSEVRSLPLKTNRKRLPVPLAIIKPGRWVDSTQGFSGDNPMSEFWRLIITEAIELYDDHAEYDVIKNLDLTVEQEKSIRESKYKDLIWKDINRIDVNLPEDVINYVSKKGLYAKSRDEYIENTGDTIGFDIGRDMDYSDYESWLTSWDDMMSPWEFDIESKERMGDLFDSSALPSETEKYIDDFMSSRLAAALDFFSACSAELNVNIRKPTPEKKMYVTYVRGYNARIAMHNTGSDKHTFYSIIVKKNDIELPSWTDCFSRWIDIGDYMCTEICSTRKHDLSMHLSMLSKALSIISMTRNVFSDSMTLNSPDSRSNKESLMSILICLENSNQTSEICMLPRFNYMQTNVYLGFNANYAVNASKYPLIVRSRLSSYLIHKIIGTFIDMAKLRDIQRIPISNVPDIDDEDDDNLDENKDEGLESQDTISNALSYVSGKPLINYEEALLLSYLGIYHNKDKAEKNQSYFQIFSKLLKMEIKMREARKEYMVDGMSGNIDPKDIRAHEFSGDHLRNCGLSILQSYDEKNIDEETLMRKIAHNLDSIYYEELATLKSSAQISIHGPRMGEIYEDKKFDLTDKDMKTKIGRKLKAMQGVVDVMREIDAKTTSPFRELTKLVLLLEAHGGVIAVLFKKNQLNGVREIFILTMIARIVIRLLESVSRTIATDCEGEYLTKGSEKSSASPAHYAKVMEKLTPQYESITLSDSLDCQTWCQNFVMGAFGNILSVVTRSWPELSEVLRGILNAVSSKRHEMPYELMKYFVEKPKEQSRDPAMRELKDQFLGDGGDLVNSMSCYIKNISNMMQGILHFTTTVTHIGHLYACGKIVRSLLLKHNHINDVVYTVKCSSDDASIMITVIVKKSLSVLQRASVRRSMAWMSEWIRYSYPMMCAKVSKEKSTCLVFKQVEEFNSQWTYRNTSLSVPTKFGFASVLGSTYRSITEKQRLDHNLINDYLGNGGTMQTAKVLEYACAHQHYEALGMYVVHRDVWNELRDNIMLLDNHQTYKYTESHPIMGTLMGFDFTQYCKSKRSKAFRLTDGKIRKRISGQIDDKLGMTIAANLIVGSDKMYYKFMETLEKDLSGEETKARIESDPSRLYHRSDSIEDSKDRIYLKSITPGIGRSFAFMSYSLQQQSCAYVLTSPSITVSVRNEDVNEEHIWVRRKMSLPAYLELIKRTGGDELIESCQKNDLYDNVLDSLSVYKSEVLKYIGRRGKKIMKLHLPKIRHGIDIDLMSCVKYFWFNTQNGHDLTSNMRCLTEYQKKMDWLRESYSDTKLEIILRGHENPDMVIYTAVMKYVEMDKSLSFMTSARKTSTIIGTLINTVIRLYKKNCLMLRDDQDVTTISTTSKLQEIESKIMDNIIIPPAVLSSTVAYQTKKVAFDLLSSDVKYDHDVDIVGSLPNHYKSLLMMTKLVSADLVQDEVKNLILKLGNGFIVSYRQAQKRTETIDEKGIKRITWGGHGIIRLDVKDNGHFIIEVHDKTVNLVRTNRYRSLHSVRHVLSKAFKFLKLTVPCNDLLHTTGLTIDRYGKVFVRSEGKRGIPVVPLFNERSSIDIIGRLRIDSGKCIAIDVYTKETLINGTRPSFMTNGRLNRSWMKSESIKFYPKINQSYRSLNIPNLSVMNSLVVTEEKEFEQFAKTSLIHRLQALGKLVDGKYRDIMIKNESPIVHTTTLEEDIARLLDFDMDMDFDFSADIGQADAAEDQTMDMEKIDGFNMEDYLEVEVVKQDFNQVFTDYSHLRIWDDWISEIEDVCSKKFRQLAAGEYRNEDIDENEGLREVIDKLIEWGIISEAREVRTKRKLVFAEDNEPIKDDPNWLENLYNSAPIQSWADEMNDQQPDEW